MLTENDLKEMDYIQANSSDSGIDWLIEKLHQEHKENVRRKKMLAHPLDDAKCYICGEKATTIYFLQEGRPAFCLNCLNSPEHEKCMPPNHNRHTRKKADLIRQYKALKKML